MLAIERQKLILKLVTQEGQMTTSDLCKRLAVSPATIRNDLTKLEKEQLIKKTHGGATIIEGPATGLAAPGTVDTRHAEKDAIATYALRYIKNGQCIVLDASSTSLALARKLDGYTQLTAVTNGIHTMQTLRELPGVTVILLGGIVTRDTASIEGLLGVDLLRHINPDLAFVSAGGFTLDEGLTDFNVYEVELKREMVARCKKTVALLDSSKLENVSTAGFCAVERIDALLTDQKADATLLERYRAAGLRTVRCSYVEA